MRKFIFALSAMLLASPASAAQGADRKLPRKFVGEWCHHSASQTYTRRRCRNTDGWMAVNANGYEAHETSCDVLKASAIPKSAYLVKFECHGEGETWIENRRMSLDNKGRLLMRDAGSD